MNIVRKMIFFQRLTQFYISISLFCFLFVEGLRKPRSFTGQYVPKSQFPYVLHYTMFEKGCTGIIKDSLTILTAAHCVINPRNGQGPDHGDIVWFELSSREADGFDAQNATLYWPQEYKGGRKEGGPFDIALIKLKIPLTFNAALQPIEIQNLALNINETCVLVGYGNVQNNYVADQYRPNYSYLKLKDDDLCSHHYPGFYDPQNSECAGGLEGNACHGDSGGALVCRSQLHGIVSRVPIPDCVRTSSPSTFVKVSAFTKWIDHPEFFFTNKTAVKAYVDILD